MARILTALVLIGSTTVFALAGLVLVRRYVPAPLVGDNDNDVAGFIYALVGVIYGIALAFVIFAVWERFSDANEAVTAEAAAVVSIYRDATAFEPALRTEARDALRVYVDGVTQMEWANHVGGARHTTPDRLNPVYDIWSRADAAEPALERVHALEEQRHLRHLSVESTLPGVFWPVLIVGALITIAFSYLFRMQRFRTQALITAAVTILVSGAIFLIMSLNRPFTGIEKVSREPFVHALQQFDAIDLRAP